MPKKLFNDNQNLQNAFQNEPNKSRVANHNNPLNLCYAIAGEGEIIKRFELIQLSGRRYSFSYALLPICIQADSSLLVLRAYELLIKISGYNLDPIRQHLNTEQLVWAKALGKHDGRYSTFIAEITIEGETVMTTL